MQIEDLFNKELKVINIGLLSFYETLTKVGVECQQVEVKIAEGSNSDE